MGLPELICYGAGSGIAFVTDYSSGSTSNSADTGTIFPMSQ